MNIVEGSTVLSSWKDIAKYLGKGVRTVQRWEQHLGLPVRRPVGALQKSAVLLHRADVDVWLLTRFTARTVETASHDRLAPNNGSVRAELRQNLQTAHELRQTHKLLTLQITESIRALNERCSVITMQSAQDPWDTRRSSSTGLLEKARQPAIEPLI